MANIFSAIFLLFIILISCFGQRDKRNSQETEDQNDNEFDNDNEYDVCVLGSGAGGMTTAVLAKAKGKSVLVIEKSSYVGGHCDTRSVTPPSAGQPDWYEIGVQQIPDTAIANSIMAAQGILNVSKWGYLIDTKQFINQFACYPLSSNFCNSTIPIEQSFIGAPHQTYITSPEVGFVVGPVPPTDPSTNPAFVEAINRFFALYFQYPWLENGLLEGPVPPELLVNFSYFVTQNNFSALINDFFNPLLYFGGLGDWGSLVTVYALRNMAPAITSKAPGATFVIKGGCQKFYDGMARYIGSDNIWTNTIISSTRRRRSGDESSMDNEEGDECGAYTRIKGTRNKRRVKAKCRKIVVAFAPTLENIDFLNPDQTEEDFFSSISTKVFGGASINMFGPIRTNTSNNFTLIHFDFTRPPLNQADGGWAAMLTQLSYAPASSYHFSNDPTITNAQLRAQVEASLNALTQPPINLITSFNIIDFFVHEYFPRPDAAALASPVGFYTRLEQLQGRRNTYWVGVAQAGMAAQHNVMDRAKRLVNAHF